MTPSIAMVIAGGVSMACAAVFALKANSPRTDPAAYPLFLGLGLLALGVGTALWVFA